MSKTVTLKIKLLWHNAITYGELVDNGVINIKVPYWVNPDVIKAIENGYCNGVINGLVHATDDQGGTTSGEYWWEFLYA